MQIAALELAVVLIESSLKALPNNLQTVLLYTQLLVAMTLVDILLLLILAASAWNGWRRGFILAAVDLILWIGSLVLALYLYGYVVALINKFTPQPLVWIFPFAFIITFIVIRLIADAITKRVLTTVQATTHDKLLNKAAGLVPGLVSGIIYAVLIVALLVLLPSPESFHLDTSKSRLANKLTGLAEWFQAKLDPVLVTIPEPSAKPDSDYLKHGESVKLPFTVKSPKPRPDLEAQMLDMVNAERRNEGLKPLKADPEMAVVARKHSADMFARGYFSHMTPDGKDPFFRMRKGGVRYLTAGENLALAPTLAVAHKGLMQSPGHRANILHRSFGRLGIGILDGGMYGLMVTQNFRN